MFASGGAAYEMLANEGVTTERIAALDRLCTELLLLLDKPRPGSPYRGDGHIRAAESIAGLLA